LVVIQLGSELVGCYVQTELSGKTVGLKRCFVVVGGASARRVGVVWMLSVWELGASVPRHGGVSAPEFRWCVSVLLRWVCL
jgi:hypothetical protein